MLGLHHFINPHQHGTTTTAYSRSSYQAQQLLLLSIPRLQQLSSYSMNSANTFHLKDGQQAGPSHRTPQTQGRKYRGGNQARNHRQWLLKQEQLHQHATRSTSNRKPETKPDNDDDNDQEDIDEEDDAEEDDAEESDVHAIGKIPLCTFISVIMLSHF
jgi:hypothetical protein